MQGVNIIRVSNPFSVRQIPVGPSLHKIVFDILILFKGLRMVKRKKYTVVHGVEEGGVIAVLLSSLSGSKAIFEKHSDPVSHKEGFVKNVVLAIYAHVEYLTVKYAKAVICTGSGLTNQVIKMRVATPVFNIPDIPSCLTVPVKEQISERRNELQQNNNEVLITYVGSFAPYQGIDLLMGTIARVLQARFNTRFILIGGKDEEIENWKMVFAKQNILQKVSFVGMISPEEVTVILSASDILLSPRTSGMNTPLKLLDYLKAGRAIVATNVEANRLILSNEIAVFTNHEPTSMAEAIVNLVDNENKRVSLGVKAKELYKSKYNFQNFSRELKRCYEHLI